jgi:hypothetical protein
MHQRRYRIAKRLPYLWIQPASVRDAGLVLVTEVASIEGVPLLLELKAPVQLK